MRRQNHISGYEKAGTKTTKNNLHCDLKKKYTTYKSGKTREREKAQYSTCHSTLYACIDH